MVLSPRMMISDEDIWVVKMSVDMSQIRWERRRKAPFAPSYVHLDDSLIQTAVWSVNGTT